MKKIHDKDFHLIEDFISGKLTPEEENRFRERLKAEPALAKACNFRIKIAQYWNEAETYDKTKKQVNELIRKENNRKRRLVTYYSVAASVIFLIGIAVLYMQRPKQEHPDNRFVLSENDTSTNNISTLSMDEQPEKGSQYVIPPEYTIHDTLIIHRGIDLNGNMKIHIENVSDKTIVQEYRFDSGTDSVCIPLMEFQPGSYRWILVGSDLSGNFMIREDTVSSK